jgi:DeoR family deoxyribose operon repressor
MQRKFERISQITRIIQDRNGSTIRELSRELAVSENTIRRDLHNLEHSNIISLVHGAAIYKGSGIPNREVPEYQLLLEKAVSNTEKERIGKAAVRLVSPGDTIIIDVGTTTEYLAKYIPQNCSITVLCFTSNVLFEIYKKNVDNLIIGGGYYHANTQLFESQESLSIIRKIRANKYFMSAAGVSKELGVTCANQYEIGVKQASIESSYQKILLADSKKFGQIKPAYFTSLEVIDMVITDTGINPEWVKIMENIGITVQVV